MTPENFNWKRFQHGILLKSSVESVFNHIATASGISKWFVGTASYTYDDKQTRADDEAIRNGDQYHWKWLNKDFESSGQVLEVVLDKSVRFTFGTPWEITFNITALGDKTKLVLSQYYQEGAVQDEFSHLNCCVCWVFFMTNLKSVLEHQTDLREVEVDDELLVNR